jgi:hypothetical protein
LNMLVGEAADSQMFAHYPHNTYLRQNHLQHVNMNTSWKKR